MTTSNLIVVLLSLLFFLGIFGLLFVVQRVRSRPTSSPEDAESTRAQIIDEAFDARFSELERENASLMQLIGEMKAGHRAELASVQQEAIIEMQKFRAELELENAKNKRAVARDTTARSRASLVAKIGEHFAPLLAGFPYNFKDARHVGEIFDFLVFDGLEDGEIKQVVFLEVKTKRSGARVTNPREKMLRDAINAGRVTYDIFVPDVREAKGGELCR